MRVINKFKSILNLLQLFLFILFLPIIFSFLAEGSDFTPTTTIIQQNVSQECYCPEYYKNYSECMSNLERLNNSLEVCMNTTNYVNIYNTINNIYTNIRILSLGIVFSVGLSFINSFISISSESSIMRKILIAAAVIIFLIYLYCNKDIIIELF
jgi:hypothetical protein